MTMTNDEVVELLERLRRQLNSEIDAMIDEVGDTGVNRAKIQLLKALHEAGDEMTMDEFRELGDEYYGGNRGRGFSGLFAHSNDPDKGKINRFEVAGGTEKVVLTPRGKEYLVRKGVIDDKESDEQ
jgi:hypothetical protein